MLHLLFYFYKQIIPPQMVIVYAKYILPDYSDIFTMVIYGVILIPSSLVGIEVLYEAFNESEIWS